MTKINNPLIIRLSERLKEQNKSIVSFSDETRIPKDRIYKWFNKGISPKAEDEKKILLWLDGVNTEQVPRENSTKQNGEKDISAKAIYNLTESNRQLAEAQLKAVSNESRLISLVESNLTGGKETSLTASPTVHDLLELIADVGSGKKWKSKQEGLAELSRLVYEKKKDK